MAVLQLLALLDYSLLFIQKYERRGRHVQNSEREKWNDITPAMMSEEEDIGDNTFKIHKPQWRSCELIQLLKNQKLQ